MSTIDSPVSAAAGVVTPPPGMPSLFANEWLHQLTVHYLDTFVAEGGAAVKFGIDTDSDGEGLRLRIENQARERSYLVASVDAGTIRVHQMEQMFYAVCRQLPWQALCEGRLLRLVNELGYEPPKAGDGSFIARLADANGLTKEFLSLPLRRQIQERVFRERTLARDFRVAMTHLCLAALDDTAGTSPFPDLVAWLTGTMTGLTQTTPYQIFSKINRHSARHLFESLTHWIAQCGEPGLLVTMQLSRVLDSRRPAAGLHYSKANAMDAYEVLRQFIDSAERLSHCLLVVIADGRFLLPQGKGVELYQALKYRVYDEVHDRRRANPLGSLVRLRGDLEHV